MRTKTPNQSEPDLWLVVGHLLRDLALGRWPQAAVWARALLRHLAGKGGAP